MNVLGLILGIFITVMLFLTILSIFYMKYDRSQLELENTKLQKDLQDARNKLRNRRKPREDKKDV